MRLAAPALLATLSAFMAVPAWADDVFRSTLNAPLIFASPAAAPVDPIVVELAASSGPLLEIEIGEQGSVDLKQFAAITGGGGIDVDSLQWTYSVSGLQSFPGGMSLQETTGIMSGTPEVLGTHSFVVHATHPDATTNGETLYSVEVTDPVYSSETNALLARMSPKPSLERARLIDDTISELKAAGLWTALDVLYLPAAHSDQAGRLNWKSVSYPMTGAAAFTIDQGLTRTTGVVSTGWMPRFGSWQYTLSNAHMGFLSGEGRASGMLRLAYDGTRNHALINATPSPTGGYANAFLNHETSPTTNNAVPGHFGISRIGSSLALYNNGTSVGTASSAAASIPNTDFGLFHSTDAEATVKAVHAGRGLTSAEMSALNEILTDYIGGL